MLDHSVLAHCVHVTDKDIELLARAEAAVVHNPSSNLKLASGICPVQKMLDAGVNVCLGTDSACSNNNLDMFMEMRNAALLGKVASNDSQACSASTVLAMATVNAAKALGLEGKLGAVQAGMRADVIAVDMDCVEVWPLSNILSHLVYACGRSQWAWRRWVTRRVTDVWVSGKQLMRERELTTLKMDELRAIGEKWEKILREFKAGKEWTVCGTNAH